MEFNIAITKTSVIFIIKQLIYYFVKSLFSKVHTFLLDTKIKFWGFYRISYLIMNVNDATVLKMINRLIAIDRLNKDQILQLVNLASISNNIHELEENMKWETFKSKY